jgi:hypothetical protein
MRSIFYLVEESLASQEGHSSMELIIQLVGWLVVWLGGWLVDRLVGWFVVWLVN